MLSKDASGSCLLSGAYHHLHNTLLVSPLLSVVSPFKAYQQHYLYGLNYQIMLAWFILWHINEGHHASGGRGQCQVLVQPEGILMS